MIKILSFLFLLGLFACQPGASSTRSMPQSGASDGDGSGDGTASGDEDLEDSCEYSANEGKREALRSLLAAGSADYNSYVKGYLENKGCQATQVYSDFVASANLTGGFSGSSSSGSGSGGSGSDESSGSGSSGSDGSSGSGSSGSDGSSGSSGSDSDSSGSSSSGSDSSDSSGGLGSSSDGSGSTSDSNESDSNSSSSGSDGNSLSTDANSGTSDETGNTVLPDGTVYDTSTTYYYDVDGDGYGSDDVYDIYSGEPIGPYATNDEDCDDNDADVNPSIFEDCFDEIDNDCDGLTDETLYYSDSDGDGYGVGTATDYEDCLYSPSQDIDLLEENGVSPVGTDCDDSDSISQVAMVWYQDLDGDGFGGMTATSVTRCEASGTTSYNSDGIAYSQTNNDCLDDAAGTDLVSNTMIDPDCDFFFPGSSKGEDCDNTEGGFNTYSHDDDQDCDGRQDWGAESGEQIDQCIKANNDESAYSSGDSLVSLDTYLSDSFATKRALHKCGTDYDRDGCWAYTSACASSDYNLASYQGEDCADGNETDAGASKIENSDYLYARFFYDDKDGQGKCDLIEFRNLADSSLYREHSSTATSASEGGFYRLQARLDEEDAGWYDVCIFWDNLYSIMGVDNQGTFDARTFSCTQRDQNYYFQIKSDSDYTWEKGDLLEILSVNLQLQGDQPEYTDRDLNSYVIGGTSGVLAVRASSNFSEDNLRADQPSISDIEEDSENEETKILWDSGVVYEDSSGAIYPIVSKGFKIKNENSEHRWKQNEYHVYSGPWARPDFYFRLVKAVCIKSEDYMTQEEILEGDYNLSLESCSHSEAK